MDSASIELPGSEIDRIRFAGDELRVHFSRAIIVKTMTGSVERTRWWQNGALVFDEAELEEDLPLPELPGECRGGDVGENVYTYRDMVPVPLESRGRAHCALRVGVNCGSVDPAQ